MKNEKWDDVHGNTTPDDRMVAFLESPTDSYAILQLREDVDDNIPLMFANYSYLQKKEMEPEIDRYEVVYHGSISMSEDVNRQLEDLYVKFNIDHPDDFRGHSMSVSDIVALKVVGEVCNWFIALGHWRICDLLHCKGFVAVPAYSCGSWNCDNSSGVLARLGCYESREYWRKSGSIYQVIR